MAATPASGPNQNGPELFFGIVATVGTDIDKIINILSDTLRSVSYNPEPTIHLSRLLRALPGFKNLPHSPLDVYINEHMTAGNRFRQMTGRNDAMALLGLGEIIQERLDRKLRFGEIAQRRAYIFRSLKHPDEVTLLRDIYGNAFYLIAAHSPHSQRRDFLARGIAASKNEYPPEKHFPEAENLIRRDEEEIGLPYGQNVRDTFHRADVFLDTSDHEALRSSTNRFVELVFGNTFHTPTKREYAMFHAKAAGLRSADLGRQVGAAVANVHGDIIAVGTNEVPKAHGGLYWCDDKPDRRDFVEGFDFNEEHKRHLIGDTFTYLKAAGWLNYELTELSVGELVQRAVDSDRPVLPSRSQIRSLIEFGRAVHAEMAALVSAAQRGVAVSGTEMFVTSFPCHLCARQIVAGGIKRVHYIEPYAKSLATYLYPDSIAIEESGEPKNQVIFLPFVGVAPRQYMLLFSMVERKTSDGRAKSFLASASLPRYSGEHSVYLEKEKAHAAVLAKAMNVQGILF